MRPNRLVHCCVGAAAIFLASGLAQAKPAWRDAYQSSPASYEAPSEDFIKLAAEHMKLPPEQVRTELSAQTVSGTLRYRVTVQAAGSQVRIRLSNEEGKAPLRLSTASIGLAGKDFTVGPGSLQLLTFGGASGVTLPPGAPVLSDPARLAVQPGTELIVSVALASPMANEGRGGAGFVSAAGDQTLREQLDRATVLKGRPLVSGISVLAEEPPHVIVAMGDSITDGNRSMPGAAHGWPEELARRLMTRNVGQAYTVVNAGIAGNRLLAPGWGAAGLARLDRDALRIDGISHLILLEGINDINFAGRSPFGINPEISADDLISGYRQVIARAHARGVKVYIGTLTPSHRDDIGSATKERIRDAVNLWIRTSREPDAVIDFDAMVRNPFAATQFRSEFDSGDHLHPSDRGYKAMGEGIDLSLFP